MCSYINYLSICCTQLLLIITFSVNDNINLNFFSPVALRPNAGHDLLILEVSRSHKTHHSGYDSSGRVISLLQISLPYNTQHSQDSNIYAPGGIRTHNLTRQAGADLRLRPRGNWDRHKFELRILILIITSPCAVELYVLLVILRNSASYASIYYAVI